MTLPEFQQQMGRLIEQFGKNSYSQARAELIWREVKDYDRFWWEKTVDHLLLTCRQAPLHAEFGPLISEERERRWKKEKEVHAKDAENFLGDNYGPEDKQTICHMIRKRLSGEVSDSDYANFIKMLEGAVRVNQHEMQQTKGV